MSVLILDSFSNTPASDINGRTPDTTDVPGTTWVAKFGTIGGNGGANNVFDLAQVGSGWTDSTGIGFGDNAVVCLYVIDSGVSDGTVRIETGAANQGIAFRYVDNNNLWFIHRVGSTVYLFQVSGGVMTSPASQSVTIDNTYKVSLSGTALQYGTDALEGSYTLPDAGTGQTKHGLIQLFYNAAQFSSFEVDGTASPVATRSLFRPANLVLGAGGSFFSNPLT